MVEKVQKVQKVQKAKMVNRKVINTVKYKVCYFQNQTFLINNASF